MKIQRSMLSVKKFEKFSKYCYFVIFFIFIVSILSNETFLPEVEGVRLPPILLDPNFELQIVATGLNFPTKMTFVDNETILVAQKGDGHVVVIKNFVVQDNLALDLNVDSGWERGFVGIESAHYNGETFVFVYYTESTSDEDTWVSGEGFGSDNNGNKLVRYTWDGTSLTEPLLLLHPLKHSGPYHHGGAMTTFDDNLYLVVGDNSEYSFLKNEPEAKKIYDVTVIFRIEFDGSAVLSNPFSDPALSKYYAYGIRNGYGIAVDPVTNEIWDTENGADDFDEINLVFPGFNSGWIKIMGPNGAGEFSSQISELISFEGSRYSEPEFSWRIPEGLTAIEFLKSKKYGAEYQNDVFIGDVHGVLYHFELNENRDGFVFSDNMLEDLIADNREEAESIIFGRELGVITDIKTGPDGYLYLLSMVPQYYMFAPWLDQPEFEKLGSMTGVIFRLVPSNYLAEFKEGSLRQQIDNGVLPSEIKCKVGFDLIFKTKNYSPACVKSLSVQKLVDRGWGVKLI